MNPAKIALNVDVNSLGKAKQQNKDTNRCAIKYIMQLFHASCITSENIFAPYVLQKHFHAYSHMGCLTCFHGLLFYILVC